MKIIFDEKNEKKLEQIFLHKKGRYPSVTDIRFINRNLIIVAHRYAYKLYLINIDIDKNSYKILDTYKTIDEKNKIHFCESFEIVYIPKGIEKEDIYQLYVIFFSNVLWIFDVNIKSYKFISKKIIILHNQNTYHGMKIYNNKLYLSPSNMLTSNKSNNILEIDLLNYTQKYLNIGDIKDNYRLKDILFINHNLILIIINYKTNIKLSKDNQITKGGFALFTFPNFILLDKIEFHHVHFDKIINDKNNNFYISGQDEFNGKIYKGTIDLVHQKIIILKDFIVDDFPHGLDIYEDLFAYTSYDTNSLTIEDLSKFT